MSACVWGEDKGGLNLRLPVPFNPGSHSVFLYIFSIAKYFVMLRNFSRFLPLPATLEIPLSAPSPPASRTPPAPFSPGLPPPCPPPQIRYREIYSCITLWCCCFVSLETSELFPVLSSEVLLKSEEIHKTLKFLQSVSVLSHFASKSSSVFSLQCFDVSVHSGIHSISIKRSPKVTRLLRGG